MNDPRHPLTPEVQQQICCFIRAGCFAQTAAEAAGIPAKTFNTWMRYGRARRPVPLYRDFLEAVHQAQAQARVVAESEARRKAPLSWLRYGPGRETSRMPGWTDPVKPRPRKESCGRSFNRFQEMLPVLLEVLGPFPEARAALADAVDKYHWLEEEYGMVPEEALDQLLPQPTEPPQQHQQGNEPVSERAANPQPSAPEPVAEPRPSAPEPAMEQPEPAPEAVVNPQPTDDPPATNPQSTGSETPPALPFGEVEYKCFPAERTGNPFAAFDKRLCAFLNSS